MAELTVEIEKSFGIRSDDIVDVSDIAGLVAYIQAYCVSPRRVMEQSSPSVDGSPTMSRGHPVQTESVGPGHQTLLEVAHRRCKCSSVKPGNLAWCGQFGCAMTMLRARR
jgi:hypothetical protein